jgi:hypothetical protein
MTAPSIKESGELLPPRRKLSERDWLLVIINSFLAVGFAIQIASYPPPHGSKSLFLWANTLGLVSVLAIVWLTILPLKPKSGVVIGFGLLAFATYMVLR